MGRDPPVIPEMSSPGPIMRASKGIDDLQTVSNNKQHTMNIACKAWHDITDSNAREYYSLQLMEAWRHLSLIRSNTFKLSINVIDNSWCQCHLLSHLCLDHWVDA